MLRGMDQSQNHKYLYDSTYGEFLKSKSKGSCQNPGAGVDSCVMCSFSFITENPWRWMEMMGLECTNCTSMHTGNG